MNTSAPMKITVLGAGAWGTALAQVAAHGRRPVRLWARDPAVAEAINGRTSEAAALFDKDVVGVLLVHNVGVEAAVWTVGVAILSGESLRRGLKKLLQPMTVALFVALALNFAGFVPFGALAFIAVSGAGVASSASRVGSAVTTVEVASISSSECGCGTSKTCTQLRWKST